MYDEVLKERMELALGRIAQIAGDTDIKEPFSSFFSQEAGFLLYAASLYEELKTTTYDGYDITVLEERNARLYDELKPENYTRCFGNPVYASEMLGEGYGPLFSALYAELRGVIVYAYEGRLWDLVITLELFLECCFAFSDDEIPAPEILKNIIYMYVLDYCPEFTDRRIADLTDPSETFAVDIVDKADLSDLRYLYAYGEYVSENEIQTAGFLNSLSENEIDELGGVIANAYIKGFAVTNKDISKKRTVNIRYALGFERIVRSAVRHFRAASLEPVIYRAAAHAVNRKSYRIGYTGGTVNPQYEYDHRNDSGIWLDERFVSRRLACMRQSFEKRKELAAVHGGPACIDIFGREPFVPELSGSCIELTREQQSLKRRFDNEALMITNRYIIGAERSFTIIAFPLPSIGADYEKIFRETIKINTLDYNRYQKIQQIIIDTLDKGKRVIVKGRGVNRTDLTVNLHELKDPLAETNFENCVADVNIPVGEVFTSPVLKGTNGILHVSSVYLNGLNYRDLEIMIKDGMAADYTCRNFDDPEENRRFVKENLMYRHDSLPVGEFAIGTNTAAYAMAKKYDIFRKLPILIAEKTGPHFAFGDTCYSFEEDLISCNPDGKAIIARENEISALRKNDPSAAYFGCHTDVTIPYDELGSIAVEREDGGTEYIIREGKFVLQGTEELNLALSEETGD